MAGPEAGRDTHGSDLSFLCATLVVPLRAFTVDHKRGRGLSLVSAAVVSDLFFSGCVPSAQLGSVLEGRLVQAQLRPSRQRPGFTFRDTHTILLGLLNVVQEFPSPFVVER